MKKIKVLNLYAGIGGNRKLWENVDVTAVELEPEIAKVYSSLYPEDKLIVGDAHEYLVKHVLDGFDFIWASPPCPSHSVINRSKPKHPKYPDIKLYEEIILLGSDWFKGKFCVENVIPYYTPLVAPSITMDRHVYWTNFRVEHRTFQKEKTIKSQLGSGSRFGFSLDGFGIKYDKRKMLRNLVNPEAGNHIFSCAMNGHGAKGKQHKLF